MYTFTPQTNPNPVMAITAPPESNISLYTGSDEMLKITSEGFFVRGVKVTQDDKEAEQVYNAFKQWLAWNLISK
jgi:hypothetical protein